MNQIHCQLHVCYWNIGLEYPQNCAAKKIEISEGAECRTFISKAEAKMRLDKAFEKTRCEVCGEDYIGSLADHKPNCIQSEYEY